MASILSFPLPMKRPAQPIWLPLVEPARPRPRIPQSNPEAAAPFAPLLDSNLLGIFDDDNLKISCDEKFGSKLSYATLAASLRGLANRCELWAVLTSNAEDAGRTRYFEARGYQALDVKREVIATKRGTVVKGNADFDLAFETAFRIACGTFDTVLLGTGDGDLALAIARGIKRVDPELKVFTLSVRGCTSARLLQHQVPHLVEGNFYVESAMLRAPQAGNREHDSRHSCRVRAARRAGGRHV